MSSSVKRILIDKLRVVLLPDFTNKLTWLLGSAGIALIAGPAVFRLIGKVSIIIYGAPIEVEFFSEDRSGYGIFLCILAVIQNIGYQVKGALSEASAIRDLDRKHEMDLLSAKQTHEVFLLEAESAKGIDAAKRKHDIESINKLISAFPYEQSCNSLIRAADTGINDLFQEQLELLVSMHHISYKMYSTEAENARRNLITQAIETQSVLSSHLVTDPRFANKYVPFYEQKYNGMREIYYENQEKMRSSCISLIRAYENFVSVLQQQSLWGVAA